MALVAPATMASAQEEAGSAVSGSLAFDFNTHFMSYGFNVWGEDEFDDLIFNPSFALDFDLGSGFSANIGTWWDVNNNAPTNIGQSIQEVDVWAGVGYAYDMFSIALTYQEWFYGGDEERIFDIGLGLDVIGSPSLTIHNRVDGNNGQDTGAVFVIGGSHGFDVGPVSLGVGVDVAFVTEDFYVPDEGGFAYFKGGASVSVPIPVPQQFGELALSGGIDYYYTDEDNVGNPDASIVTAMFGLSLGF